MTDKNPVFNVLQDGSGEGHALSKMLEGDAVAAQKALAGFVAKRITDNSARYLNMDAAGNLLVTMDGGGTPNKARGTVAGNLSFATVCDITLTADAVYRSLEWVTSCFREAIYEIVLIDDPTGTPVETILADVLCGPGDFTDAGKLSSISFTAGSTDPILRLRGKNLNATSDFRGSIATVEDAA